MKRVISLALAATMLCGTLAGCAGSDSGKPTLTVYNWGDYIGEDVIEKFEDQYDCKVNYEMFEQNEDMYTKLKTVENTYDVVIPSDYMIERMINEGMLEELNKENIPNLEHIISYCLDRDFDPGNVYSVPYMWGTVGIIYNTTMVDEPITGWKDLWDEKYEKNLFMMNSVRDSMGIALILCGYDMNSRDPEEIEEAKNKLIEQKPLVLAYTGDEVKDKMVAGEAAMAVCYSGDAITMIEQNEDLAYVIPEEGSNLWFDNMCIPKGAPNKELAEQFINFMCSEEIAAENRDYINYSTPQQQVLDNLPDEIKNDPVQYPDEETLARCEIYKDLGDMASTYDEFWTKIMVN